ncbi:MAG: WGR domain-containing protein [Myxococcales bacterium]
MGTVRKIELFFQEGTSDKVYNARIVEDGPGTFTVKVEWGRRGSSLNEGTKAVRVTREVANRKFDSLVREKTGKGYEEVAGTVKPAAVAPPVGEGSGSKASKIGRPRTGQAAQLLNAVDDAQLQKLLADDHFIAQQKLDGVRMLIKVGASAEATVATNRQGQVMELAESVKRAVLEAPVGSLLDGELVRTEDGPVYHLFDLLAHGTDDLRAKTYLERYQELDALCDELSEPVRKVAMAQGAKAKKALYEHLESERAEGIVFKRTDAPYAPGRPASGGPQLKYKFVKTADVFLTENAGNAYQMAVMDEAKVRLVGKVFAGTTNESRKELDALLGSGERPVAEVRYLYATDDDVLFQPVFAQLRDDKAPEDCLLSQLVHTNRKVVGGDEE